MALRKLVLNLDENLVTQLDIYATEKHVNRTAAIAFLLTSALEQKQAINTLDELLRVYHAEQAKQANDKK